MPESSQTVPDTHDRAFQVQRGGPRAVLRLKSWQSDRTGGAPLTLAGVELPDSVGTAMEGAPRVLCTGPREWLMVYAPTRIARLRNILAPELAAQSLALVDLTPGLAVFEVSGSAVREILAKSCGLNFHPRRFGAGHCARTRFAQIPVVIDCLQDSGIFELYTPRSYAHYLKDWLCDAAQGIPCASNE